MLSRAGRVGGGRGEGGVIKQCGKGVGGDVRVGGGGRACMPESDEWLGVLWMSRMGGPGFIYT